MLIDWIAVAVVVVVLAAALLTRRLTHDDVHSVEGYHRSLHTLESINAHPAVHGGDTKTGDGPKPAYPESAVRVAGTSSVRVTDRPPFSVPPVPPPLVAEGDRPVTFDDAGPPPVPAPPLADGHRDKWMSAINHRPRRLAAPALAIAAVIVLVVVLLLTGSHTVAPRSHHAASSGGHARSIASKPPRKRSTTSTSTTQLPAVSLPQSATAQSATYEVSNRNFTLALSATSGACWVDATNSTSGSTYFIGTLAPGAQQSFDAVGPVTIVVGAPTVFVATVDGSAVALPSGFQTPFTMSFVTIGSQGTSPAT
jgi:uncharacterized protein YceK